MTTYNCCRTVSGSNVRFIGGLHNQLRGPCIFRIVHVKQLPSVVPLHEWSHILHTSFLTDLDDVTYGAVQRAWSEIPPSRDEWCSNIELPTAVRLPIPFAALCTIGTWDTFCVCELRGSEGGRGGWRVGHFRAAVGERGSNLRVPRFDADHKLPAPRWEVNAAEVDSISFYQLDVAEHLADLVRGACGRLRELDPDFDLAPLHLHMAAFHGFVDELRGQLVGHGQLKSRSKAYDAFYLIKCFLLCDVLSSASHLKKALYHASRILLPPRAASIVQEALDKPNAAVPSPSTISRLRGRIDVVWMMIWSARSTKWLQTGVVIYGATDSSPQGGRDYQILVMDYLPRDVLPQLHVTLTNCSPGPTSTCSKTHHVVSSLRCCKWFRASRVTRPQS